MIKNNQKRIFYFTITFSLIFFITFIYSIINFNKLNDYGGLILMFSLLLFLTSFVFIFIIKKRSNVIDKAIKKNEYLAKWFYSKKEWLNYLSEEYKIKLIEKKLYFWIISFIMIIVFGIFILFIKDARKIMFFILIGFLLLFYILSRFVPWIDYHYKKKQKPYALLLEKGVYIAGHFHTWDFPLSKLTGKKIRKKPIKHILISYEFFDRLGPRFYSLMVPIPNKIKDEVLEDILKKMK